MAFYIAICLLAALAAVSESADAAQIEVLGVVWGTSIGLALAHLFAFRLAARLVAGEPSGRHDAALASAQLLGAAAIASVATVPVMVLPTHAELDVTRVVLAATIGLAGYRIARDGGASTIRSLTFSTAVITIGLVTAVTKNILSVH